MWHCTLSYVLGEASVDTRRHHDRHLQRLEPFPSAGLRSPKRTRFAGIFLRLLILGWKMLGGRQRQAKEQREAARRKIPAVVCGFVAFAASLATLIDCELRGLDAVRAV